MSSAANSLKQAAGEAPADEPTQKKVKIEEPKDSNKPSVTAKSDSSSEGYGSNVGSNNNNNNSSSGDAKKTIPSKAVNGGSQEPSQQPPSEILDEEDDDLDSLEMGAYGPKISEKLEQVSNIQSEICNLNEKASEEILKVEQKFNKLRRPHFEKRNEILKEIPNFWLTSMANHPIIAPMIETPEDEDCLHYMVNLDVEEFEDIKSGYKLKLHFVDNPYITNQVITKEFQVLSTATSPSHLEKPIEYKNTPQGQKLKSIVEESLASSRSSRVRSHGDTQSFFAWLTESSNDEIAEILKDQIWPNPLEFFFATPDTYEAGTDESDDEDEEIDDEDLDDEDDLENIEVEYNEELEDEAEDEDVKEYDEEDVEDYDDEAE